jgi:cobalt-zinc-cadmium resistance protein CzcA
LGKVPGAQDVFSLKNDGVQYFKVEVDRLAAGRYGLSMDDMSAFLKAHLEGLQLGIVQEGARARRWCMRAGENVRLSPALFESLAHPHRDGIAIPLREVAQADSHRRAGGGEPGKRGALRHHPVQRRRSRSGRLRRGSEGEASAQEVKLPQRLSGGLRRPVREPATRSRCAWRWWCRWRWR